MSFHSVAEGANSPSIAFTDKQEPRPVACRADFAMLLEHLVQRVRNSTQIR